MHIVNDKAIIRFIFTKQNINIEFQGQIMQGKNGKMEKKCKKNGKKRLRYILYIYNLDYKNNYIFKIYRAVYIF